MSPPQIIPLQNLPAKNALILSLTKMHALGWVMMDHESRTPNDFVKNILLTQCMLCILKIIVHCPKGNRFSAI